MKKKKKKNIEQNIEYWHYNCYYYFYSILFLTLSRYKLRWLKRILVHRGMYLLYLHINTVIPVISN